MILPRIVNRINSIIKRIFYKIGYGNKLKFGKALHFRKGFVIDIRKDGKVIIGNRCFFNNYCSINSRDEIKIGENCIFGENVKIYDHNHRFNGAKPIYKQGYTTGKIEIGDNCWIGSNVTILKNAKIGNNVVISAGCVINERVSDNTIVKLKQDKIVEKIKIKGE